MKITARAIPAIHPLTTAIIAATLAAAAPAMAQEPGPGVTELGRVSVTGSRIKRTDVETSQPVFSMSREQIQAQGQTSIGDIIQNISTNGSALNTNYNNGGNGETRVNLRNLGSSRTLVLVNGRRWVGGTGLGGAVDLNTIPTAAVERIDVLKDGASVLYGSDAIAGVINVVLRSDFDGAEANVYAGQYDRGDGRRQSYDALLGSVGDRYSAMVGAAYVQEDGVWAGDRAISAVPNFRSSPGYGGSSSTPNGRFGLGASGVSQCVDGSSGPPGASGQPTGCWFTTPDGADRWRPYRASDAYNFAPDNLLATPQERTSVFASASADLNDNVRVKGQLAYNERRSEQVLAAMPVTLGRSAPGTKGEDIVISAQSIYNPYGRDVTRIQRRTTETGGRIYTQDVSTFSFNGGLEGDFAVGSRHFSWDAGMYYGKNKQADVTTGLFNVIALRQALGPSFVDAGGTPRCGTAGAAIADCVPLNLLGGQGSITGAMQDYAAFEAHDLYGYEQKSYFANVSGELFALPGGTAAFALGVESRKESGYDAPDALVNSGNTTGNARTATRGGYAVDEAYLELDLPLLAELPGIKLLELNAATRASRYDTFGSTRTAKFGLKWKPIDDLLVRANWSEGFRAPSINELYSGVSDTFLDVSDPCASLSRGSPQTPPASCAGVPAYNQSNTQIRTTVGGNVALGPELSTSRTVGFVYSPGWLPGLDLSLDWWNIQIERAIQTQDAQAVFNDCYFGNQQGACGLIQRTSSGEVSNMLAVSRNIGRIDAEGFDLTVNYRLPETRLGSFGAVLDSTYYSRLSVDQNGDGVITEDPVSGEGGNQVGEYGSRVNAWRIRSNLALTWSQGNIGATANLRYYSAQTESCFSVPAAELKNLCSDPGRVTSYGPRPENRIPSVTYTDLSGYWSAPWNARITVGLNNAFDRSPPRSASVAANSFDPQYELPGRFYYMRYTQKF
ncbi:TonB-dependent receptor [Bacillus subtilis subsp. subtilis]|nr:TonB-dependent receptor [Bacillus subtilis subsp. subtilis]